MADQQDQNPGDSQPAEKTDGKKSKKMKTSSTKNDAIDKGKTLTGSKPDAINMNPVYTNVNSSFEANFGDELNELTTQQRMKKALNFRKIQSKVQIAKTKSMLRKGSGKVIAKRAKVLAIKIIKKKLAGNRDLKTLSPMEKQRIEKIMGKASNSGVDRLALRLIPTVKKNEAKRFLKKESVDLDNLAESVALINEIVNCAAGGGVRGMGHISGTPDGDISNHVSDNINAANQLSTYINQLMQDHNDMHYSDDQHDENIAPDSDTKDNIMGQKKSNSKVTKESVKLDPNDTHQRDDGTDMLVRTFKHDTPGETKSLKPTFKRKVKGVDEAFETFLECDCEREAMPRSGQNRKSMDNVIRSAISRKVSGGPYRQQSIQKKIIDEQLVILENAVSSIDKGEYDFEGAMARTQLQTIYRNAKNLIDTLKTDENMPEWVQSKITIAQDYIACVNDYLMSRKELGEASYMNKIASNVASSVKKNAIKASGLDELDPNKIVNDTLDSVGAKEITKILTPPKKLKEVKKMGNPCWKGYKAYGMKMKNGKKVPNCVPVKEDSPAWQKKEGKNETGGLNQKGVDSYRREHPGSHLQTAVTTKPSELKAGSKAANRRKSFCARMSGMKKHNTSAKTAHDPDSRINKSLRKWNC